MHTQPVDDDAVDGRARRSPLRLLFRVVAGLVIAASFGVWVYAYSGSARRDAPDLLADRTSATQAEEICAAAVADVTAMPGALDATDGPERAEQVLTTTARYEAMVDDLDQLAFSEERDRLIVDAWLDDWRVLLQDRRVYADAIAVDPEAQFLVTDTGVSERLDRRITRLANTNIMSSCAAPTDIG